MASQFTLLGTHIQGVLNGIIDAVNGKAPSSHNHDDRYWHSGNDGSGSGLDADLLDGIESSRFVYGNSGNRIGTNLISNWNQTDYPDVAFLSAENGGTNAPASDYSYGMQYSFHRSGAGYRTQFVTSLYSDLDIWVRNSRDSDVWTSWKKLIHSGNVGSQSVNYANSAGSANTSLTVTGKSSISYEAHVAGANDYNLELYSDDTGDGSRYVSLRFHQGSRYWGQIRYNSAGFRLTGGADDSLNNLYAGVYYATGGNSTNWNTAYGWGNNYISDVRLSESNLEFTGEGSAFTGTIDLSGLPFQPAGSYLTSLPAHTHDDRYYTETESDARYPLSRGVLGTTTNVGDSGTQLMVGVITETSSIRFKENITPLAPALDKVNQLEAVSYNKIGVDDREIGLIAEDVAELFPEVVTYNEEGQPQGIQYQRLSVILLKAVQELTERVNKLENK
jgi:hypothetical protein